MEKADLLAKSKDSLIDHQDETIRPLLRNSFFFLSNTALLVVLHLTLDCNNTHFCIYVPVSVGFLFEIVRRENHKRLTNTSERTHNDKKFTFNIYCRS